MEEKKKKLNLKIIIPVVVVIVVLAIVGIVMKTQKYYNIGETATNKEYEFTLEKYEFVDSIYDTSFSNITENDIARQMFSPAPKTKASEENTILAVQYKVKNISKNPKSPTFTFGTIDYNNGYKFDSMSSQGTFGEVNLIRYGNNIYKQYTTFISPLQPLSEAVTIEAFYEVKKEIKENENAPLIYKNLGFEFKIR